MRDDTTNFQSSTPDGYVSFVIRIWVGNNGRLIRGVLENAHTGSQLALDLSALTAFLQESLQNTTERAWDMQVGEEE